MKHPQIIAITLCCLVGSGCSYLIENRINKVTQQISNSVLNFEDPETVASAMPTLMILSESMASSPDASSHSLLSAAKIYSSFSSAFVSDKKRQKTLTRKGLNYVERGSCKTANDWCKVPSMSPVDFSNFVKTLNEKDIEVAYAYATTLLSYIEAHNDDWNVIADLSKATQLLELVIRHDEAYDNAGAHLYLGAIATTLPPAMGGKPEVAKQHFERALLLTKGHNLVIKVEYARRYARIIFDKDLHHQLLSEVLAANPKEDGLTLMNTWAQQEAQKLLADESNYFD